MASKAFRCVEVAALLFLALGKVDPAVAQVSGGPSTNCHVTDGTFTACANGKTEWSDVTPVAFPASSSYLYVNQDTAHTFLYLMYDLPVRTAHLAATDSVHINFDTVETQSALPALVVYDIYIFGNGQMQVLQNGQPTPAGRIVGAAGFGSSPNSATPHVMAELQVPLSAGPPSTYSPDPLFWGASLPPTPPPPPPPCPVVVLGVCIKTQAQIDTWNLNANFYLNQAALTLSTGQQLCLQPVEQLTAQAEQAIETLNTLVEAALVAAKAAEARGNLQPGTVESALVALETTANEALQSVQTGAPPGALEATITTLAGVLAGVTDAATAAAIFAVLTDAAVVVTAVTAVAAVYQAGQIVGCLDAVFAQAALEYTKYLYYLTLAQDPADPNFTVIATPVVPSSSVQPLTTATGFNSKIVNDLNSLFLNLEQEIALLQVIPTTLNRESGAIVAGNKFWQTQQAQAVQKYATQLIPLLKNEVSLREALTSDFTTSGVVFTFSQSDLLNTLSLLKVNGFPAATTAALTQLGIDGPTQAAILRTAISTDPVLVASLGTGAFPQALSDPTLSAATNNAINALSGLAGKEVFLIGSDAISFHGDTAFASQLWGHLGTNVAYINDFGLVGSAAVDGQAVTGFSSVPASLSGFSALFFASPGRCCNDPATDSSLGITSNAPAIGSFVAGGGILGIENFQGASAWDSILGFPSTPGVIYGAPFPGCADPGVSTATGAAAGFTGNGAGPNTYVDGCFIHQAYSDSFFASNGFTSLIDAGASSGLPSGSGVVLAKGSASGTVATAVTTVTAAVVEANANGETIANLRGLAATDAPTLQDQIQMIVQFRVIQNPSTDATQLTTQLVNSLPPSVLPPGQATNIISAVTKNLAPPPPVISGMPGPGCSLWPPNGKLVQVATVTAADAVGGLLPGSFTVTGTSNEPSDDSTSPEIVITLNGSGGYVIQLQARRLGTGTGRIYTLTATAKNSVGTATTSIATCTVPHDQGH